MFVHMGGHWPYKCTLVFPHHWSKGVHWPLPLQSWWKLVELLESVWSISPWGKLFFHNVLSFHILCMLRPQLCSPVPFGVFLSHICSKCLAAVEVFCCLFHWAWSPCGLFLHCGHSPLHQTVVSSPSWTWWIFHTGHNSPLQSLAFSPNAVVWKLPALLSPLLCLVSLHDPLSQSWPWSCHWWDH